VNPVTQGLPLRLTFRSSTLDSQDNFPLETTVNATALNFQNALFYAPRTLIITYGATILLASVCLAVGVAAMYNNGVAYTNNFSTILRITRDAAFDRLIEDDEDRAGADPLPTHIADATIGFVSGQDQHLGTKFGTPGVKLLRQG
jgi:hypothetical protein